MGVYDTIHMELECPKKKIKSKVGVQVKWTEKQYLEDYNVGDDVGFGKNMDNVWVREEYICDECKKRHYAYINLKNGVVKEIIAEAEFKRRNLTNFLDYSDLL
tara:strand:+ start:1045 stop:1353 length:309 start_codon:yes stop_codon:yes gene_type:complete